MAAFAISSHSAHSSLLLCRLSSFSSSSESRIRSLSSPQTLCTPFRSFNRARSRCISVFVEQEEPYAITDDPPFEDVKFVEEIKILDDLGGGFGGVAGGDGDDFGGSGDGGGNGGEGGETGEGDGGGEPGKQKKMSGMSMSQKLTLGYAALVGVGGIMGYIKSGSQKSLAAGGGSALLLYYVYTQLPTSPTVASALGLGLSAALLAVMGTRFKRSGKIFPAGVVSIISFIMAGGYFHGILRTWHA